MTQKYLSFIVTLLLCTSFGSLSAQDVFSVARTGTKSDMQRIVAQKATAVNERNESGFTPLILAVYRSNNEVAKFLVDSGADVNASSGMGTALMAAIVKGNTEMALYLLDHKADPNLKDDKGMTALMYAAMFRSASLIKPLLAKGADKTAKDVQGKTAFEYAVFSGDEATINLLK